MGDMFFDVEKIKAFILSPEKSFKGERSSSLDAAFIYFLKTLIILAVLNGIVLAALAGGNAITFFVTLVMTYIVAAIGIIIASLWLHLWAYIMGARKGLDQTMKTVLYASTPLLVLGWIPVITILLMIWGLILQVIGLKELQKMTTGRAALAVVLPIIIVVVIVAVLVSAALMMFMPMLASGNFTVPPGTIPPEVLQSLIK